MRKAALLYNPDSGGGRRRQAELESALAVLREGGVEASLVPTESRHHAGDEARRALDAGCDTVFACGGDGTIHNIVQTLANTPVAVAILPMGTANALAHDLGLPRKIVPAARAALHGVPKRIGLGRVEYVSLEGKSKAKYFVLAAGVGVDAHLFYKLYAGAKQKMGMTAYYRKALQLLFSYRMRRFATEYTESESGEVIRAEATELMSVRIRNFGGIAQEIAPGASLDRDDMRLICCLTSSRVTYLRYVARCVLRQGWAVPGIDLAFSKNVSCEYLPGLDGQKIYVEGDGELLGTLPVRMTMALEALTVLAPR